VFAISVRPRPSKISPKYINDDIAINYGIVIVVGPSGQRYFRQFRRCCVIVVASPTAGHPRDEDNFELVT